MTIDSDQRNILLVDDTEAEIQAEHNILKDTYILKIATSGVRALELGKVLPQPDLIPLGVMIPEMDGYEVCSRSKVDPDSCDIPIISLTDKTSTAAPHLQIVFDAQKFSRADVDLSYMLSVHRFPCPI